MSYRLDEISFFVRETKPARFTSALGKAAQAGAPAENPTSPLCHARLLVTDDTGRMTFGCAADRLSVRWLDKRPGRDTTVKRRELAALLDQARRVYLEQPRFETPFGAWRLAYPRIMAAGRAAEQEDLTASFASALLERALLDATCRLAGKSLHAMLRDEALGYHPGEIHPSLRGMNFPAVLPVRPTTTISIRHTVGFFDPLSDEDWPPESRLNDGLPETVTDYVNAFGVRYFKVKISGDTEADLRRLARLWEVLPFDLSPAITLDANEAYEDLEVFANFVRRLEREQLGLFQHILYIEQPLPRALALSERAAKWIREISRAKPLIIDESDGQLDSFARAWEVGYAGTSHKNCKGVFKSLSNLALQARLSESGRETILSPEDLQNLPVVPLQQDFVTVGVLGLEHCERNGHHYNFGLSMLSPRDKQAATSRHPDLYERRGDEWFLRIRGGAVDCASLHGPGFGVMDEPDWESMTPLDQWLNERHPAP